MSTRFHSTTIVKNEVILQHIALKKLNVLIKMLNLQIKMYVNNCKVDVSSAMCPAENLQDNFYN
jgi:hypothetical protein